MKRALQEAQAAYDKSEIPIGAVIVADNQIIARAHNLTQTLNDVTAHAEMQAITAAANFLGGKYLHKCTLWPIFRLMKSQAKIAIFWQGAFALGQGRYCFLPLWICHRLAMLRRRCISMLPRAILLKVAVRFTFRML